MASMLGLMAIPAVAVGVRLRIAEGRLEPWRPPGGRTPGDLLAHPHVGLSKASVTPLALTLMCST